MNNIKWVEHFKNCMKKKRFLLLFLLASMMLLLLLIYTIRIGDDLKSQSQTECLFCKIANGRQTPPILEFETDEYVIFKDKRPAAEHHFLAIPKLHYESLKVLNKSHIGLVDRMQNGMIQFLESKGVDTTKAVIGYHLPPFISQKHLHLHGISPASDMDLSDRISFFTPSFWFKTAKDALESLNHSDL